MVKFKRDTSTLVSMMGNAPAHMQVNALTAADHLAAYLDEMKPVNPVERMLAVQMLWNHQRVAHLSHLACIQTHLDTLKAIQHALDEAMNTSRRQAATWAELKAPRPVQFIKGQTVNVAEQQVVAGGMAVGARPQPQETGASSANEQGSPNPGADHAQPHADAHEHASAQPAALPPPLPPLDFRVGIASRQRVRAQAVDAKHRAEDG